VFEEPVTTAVNCCGAEEDVMLTLDGETEIPTPAGTVQVPSSTIPDVLG
jgi:hypothetical protein